MKHHCTEYDRLDRFGASAMRGKHRAAFANHAELTTVPGWLPKITLADQHVGPRGDVFVCIFMRGGADALNIIVPHGESRYYEQRPNIAIPRPDDRQQARTIDLDGFFGLHPSLERLKDIYAQQELGIVHAVGAPDETRSHFAAQHLTESGVSHDNSGWLARHLSTLSSGDASPLRAVSVGSMLPASLFGADAVVVRSLNMHRLRVGKHAADRIGQSLQTMYSQAEPLLAQPAQHTLATLDLIRKAQTHRQQRNPDRYSNHPFARALRSVADLISAEVGVEVATVDMGGWDTHAAQGGTDGVMARQLSLFAETLAAFYEDIAQFRHKVTVVVMSEFGRRLAENGSKGTDHGHGGMMMLLGGGIQGGQVVSDWPGLEPEQLSGPGDLSITIDYRDILGEILQKRLRNTHLDVVFPNYKSVPRSIANSID